MVVVACFVGCHHPESFVLAVKGGDGGGEMEAVFGEVGYD